MSLAGLLRRPRFKLPRHTLGADLFWWRETAGVHTLVTIYPATLVNRELPPSELTLVLFDDAGAPVHRWTVPLAQRPIVIDSVALRRAHGDAIPADGVLAAFVTTKPKASEKVQSEYSRLYSLVDWYSDDGDLVSLHNDQSIVNVEQPIEFTEIVFRETADECTSIVLVNGTEPQAAGSLTLGLKNHDGAERAFVYPDDMDPFTVHEIALADHVPDLIDFCDGRHATLTGTFACRGLFTRPYVMSRTPRLAGYHGGDRYAWNGVTRAEYDALSGRGPMNPMAVLHTDEVRTTVNIFNTHGHLEEDAWVEARVYDAQGALVAHRERWLLAKRHELARGDIADLLPDSISSLAGHVALNFTDDGQFEFPGTVQALMEYRTRHGAARTMAWADHWNSVERQAKQGIPLAAYYRMLCDEQFRSFIAISNAGVPLEYDRAAPFTIRLINVNGEERTYEGMVGPNATVFESIDHFFPGVRTHLAGARTAVAVVESAADLALMHFTRHEGSGVWSAEHFMALATYDGAEWVFACGS